MISARFDLDGKELHFFREIFDYRPVDGLLFPFGFTYDSREALQQNGRVEKIETNFNFPGEWVAIPREFK
jgi:hypothetical protein